LVALSLHNVDTGFQARVAERSSAFKMTNYERNLPHLQQESRPYFVTFATHKRTPLPAHARDIVLSACHYHHEKTCDLLAAVIMPDHVHLILAPFLDEDRAVVPLHWITRSIKGYSARQINNALQRAGQVWQDESFDHIIRKGNFHAKLDYLLQNPVRNGLAKTWEEYKWCYWKGSVIL
jgi:REP element-mobilizing transposase RayT